MRIRLGLVAVLLAACSSTDSIDSPAVETTQEPSNTTVGSVPVTSTATTEPSGNPTVTAIEEFPVPPGSHPHDVAPTPDGRVWYTAQGTGSLGLLDPATGVIEEVGLGAGSAPHGVIVGPDGAAWVTDGGLNAIMRVDQQTLVVEVFPLPGGNANLNTAAFDGRGILWFTGQAGIYGRLDPALGHVEVFEAPGGRGPYGITATPQGEVFYASLAGSHIARIDTETGAAERIEPPTPNQGSRRVWSDSEGGIWVSEWDAGQLGRYDPASREWREWPLPGQAPQPYAVYVDETDRVWLSDFSSDHALVRFDPTSEVFESFPLPTSAGAVRQLLGREGEVWGGQSAADALVVVLFDN